MDQNISYFLRKFYMKFGIFGTLGQVGIAWEGWRGWTPSSCLHVYRRSFLCENRL